MGVQLPLPAPARLSYLFSISYKVHFSRLTADFSRHKGHLRYKFGYSQYLLYFV
jgi:hypothetical protein